MPKSFEGNAARRISSTPPAPVEEAPKRPRLRVVKNETPNVKVNIEGSAKQVSDAEAVQIIKTHEASLHHETQEPNKNAKKVIQHYESVFSAAASKGTMEPEMLHDLLRELRTAKQMLEGRQAFLNTLEKPNSVEIAANWELIQRIEKMIEVVHMEPEEALHTYQQGQQIQRKRSEHGGLTSRHKEERDNLKRLTDEFIAEHGVHPEELASNEAPTGLFAKAAHWFRKQRAEGDLSVWQEAKKSEARAKSRVEQNKSFIQPKKVEVELPKPVVTPEIQEAVKKEKVKQEKSKIGLEALSIMNPQEAQKYVPQARDLWDLAHEQLAALPTEKARTQAMNLIHSFNVGGNDAAETKFVYEIARLHKASAIGADQRTQETIGDRLGRAAGLLGVENNALYQSALAYRPEAITDVLQGTKERQTSTRQRNSRRS